MWILGLKGLNIKFKVSNLKELRKCLTLDHWQDLKTSTHFP